MLPKALIPELENDIVYNARVTRVEHGDGPVVAHYQSIEGTDVSVSGDYLLTTAQLLQKRHRLLSSFPVWILKNKKPSEVSIIMEPLRLR